MTGLSLRGSGYDLSRSRSTKKLHVKAQVKRRQDEGLDNAGAAHLASGMVLVTTVDALMQELRRIIHAMFCKVDPSLGTANWYDNCSRQAFQFFTTTNSITSEAFHHKVSRLGIRVSRQLCVELFGRIDQEDLGEISYATFARRIFLPEPFFAMEQGAAPAAGITSPKQDTTAPRPMTARVNTPSTNMRGVATPRNRLGTASALEKSLHPTTPRSRNAAATIANPAIGPPGSVVPYELMTLDRLAKCVVLKLEERLPPGGDTWYENAFRLFTQAEGISFAEFRAQLDQLQIQLSPSKARVLFDRLDSNGNGLIGRTEFTSGFMRIRELLTSSVGGYVLRAPTEECDTDSPRGDSTKIKGTFEVEAGRHLSIKQIMAKLRDKLEQHTSKESDRFRQAFKIFSKSSGITPYEFNAAMGKLGFKLSEKQLQDLFDIFDFDQSGDLDLNEFVQGVMLDDYSTAFWSATKDEQKLENTRVKQHNMAANSVRDSWTIKEVEQMLREKIEQRTSKSSDCFRQAFRIFKKVNGIKPDEFHRSLQGIGLTLSREQADILFGRFDKDGSGDIDLDEFIHGVLPPDYIGHQWVAAADEMHRIAAKQKKMEALARPDHYMTEIEMETWSLDEIEKRIRDKIEQSTSKSSDIFRQAYRIFKKSSRITMDEFRERLLALGFRLTPEQCEGLFHRYDVNRSGDIDLQEFCMRILPPDYTGDGDYWSHSDRFKKEMRNQKVEYAKRSRNGLVMLPRFEDSRRYTRGHYVTHTFEDLRDDSSSIFHSTISDCPTEKSGPRAPQAVTPSTISHTAREPLDLIPEPMSPSRPMTPRAPRTPRPPSASGAHPSAPISPCRPTSGYFGGGNPSVVAVQNEANNVDCSSPSPRKMRIASASKHEIVEGPRSTTLLNQPPSPYRPPGQSPRRVPCVSPRQSAAINSPQSSPSSPAKCPVDIEFEDVEVLEEEVKELEDTLNALRARREPKHRHKSKSHRHHKSRSFTDSIEDDFADGDDEIVSIRAAESVGGDSTRSTGPKGIGGAKYTPQRGHVLLLKRFMNLSSKGEAEGRGVKSSRRRP